MGRDRQRDCGATAVPQNRNIEIQQERAFTRRHACSQQWHSCCEPGRQFKFELKLPCGTGCREQIFEEHWPQKLPIHGLYVEVAYDSCLPCKHYCRTASCAAACCMPVALLVASRVSVPSIMQCTSAAQQQRYMACHDLLNTFFFYTTNPISLIVPTLLWWSWTSVIRMFMSFILQHAELSDYLGFTNLCAQQPPVIMDLGKHWPLKHKGHFADCL